MHSLLRS